MGFELRRLFDMSEETRNEEAVENQERLDQIVSLKKGTP